MVEVGIQVPHMIWHRDSLGTDNEETTRKFGDTDIHAFVTINYRRYPSAVSPLPAISTEQHRKRL